MLTYDEMAAEFDRLTFQFLDAGTDTIPAREALREALLAAYAAGGWTEDAFEAEIGRRIDASFNA